MNRTKLKNYAPAARRDFIQAMTDRAGFYGLTATKVEPITEKGDVAVIAGREHPRAVAKKRKQLEDRIHRHGPDWAKGFAHTMEALAYTWFNRLVAIRFMELHGYLDHGYRVLSHPEGKPTPEVLEHAEHVDLPGLTKDTVIDLKLAGNKEGELYRVLLIAQCNALSNAMPFLFEKIDDETELLLPDNLLHSDSLIRKLVNEIDEADWQEVEIIGWLYQFYISEKKDEVIGSVVASEDIPAATQLFTPNWIVKYLVQNTLGRQWLATYPQSALRQQMQYYIEPAEQTPEVHAQLKAITPATLNPEELTLLDPACGSGHILVEAYDLFKAIYQERGYRAKDIPALILQKNLFGLEIDDRAAQLAAFALMMKARADDRRIFDGGATPNVVAFQDSVGMDAGDITRALNAPINKDDVPSEYLVEEIGEEKAGLFGKKVMAEKGHVLQGDIMVLLELFENAKAFGSLIQVSPKLSAKLPEIEKRLDDVTTHGDLTHASAHVIRPLLHQARFLVRQYDAVVANPPYMGNKSFNTALRNFASLYYPENKSDLFSMSIERYCLLSRLHGFVGLMTPLVWMSISSYEYLRRQLFEHNTIQSLIHPENHSFFESAFVSICAFIIQRCFTHSKGTFFDLRNFYGADQQCVKLKEAIDSPQCSWRYTVASAEFLKIPGGPVSYWVSDRFRRVFTNPLAKSLGDIAPTKKGLITLDDKRFIRHWSEVNRDNIFRNANSSGSAIESSAKWFPINKGGGFRRWFGFQENVLNWKNNGSELKSHIISRYGGGSYTKEIRSESYYFREAITWGSITISLASFRYSPVGSLFSSGGPCAFPNANLHGVCGLLNSSVVQKMLEILCPTLNFVPGELAKVPVLFPANISTVEALVKEAIELSVLDWNLSETSMGFERFPMLTASNLADAFEHWSETCGTFILRMNGLEEENNRLFIEAYGLQDELSPEVPDDQITLYRPNREEDIKRLLSYAIGCMMGRYSLDKPGLVYAHSGNQGFDPSQYKTFRADDDGVLPLLETDWGIRDDATRRVVEFIGVAWPKEHLEENLKFIADSLGPTGGEQPRDTIRRYLTTGFYKHHLSMYKRRPIYWLFSSGKQRAFQCLVYLHRYNEGTLARMRTEYVIPLQGLLASRIDQLEGDKAKATSTSHRTKLQKEQDALKKQQAELATFEEKLKHAADQRISLDLDDGVKVNYGKFGDLLADVKAVTGGKEEE